jgi:hypothetical protein
MGIWRACWVGERESGLDAGDAQDAAFNFARWLLRNRADAEM